MKKTFKLKKKILMAKACYKDETLMDRYLLQALLLNCVHPGLSCWLVLMQNNPCMDRRLSQHRSKEGSKIPGSSGPSHAGRVPQTITYKGVLIHTSQKVTVTENLGTADFIFIYHKFTYFFFKSGRYEPK